MKDVSISDFVTYSNGTIHIVYHDLSNIHPHKLTWVCRELLSQQKDLYDIFMYIEDDILVPMNTLEYWVKYHKNILDKGYNLGFVRIETYNNIEYISDLPGKKFDSSIIIDDMKYAINNINPYCAFWIYSKEEMNKWVSSKYYDIKNIAGYGIREASAIGLHSIQINWYKATLIPLLDNKLISDCRIYHLPNNYVNKYSALNFATIPFQDAYAPE